MQSFTIVSMKLGTPTSLAPAVSVFGIMISATSDNVAIWSSLKKAGLKPSSGFALQPFNTAEMVGAEIANPSAHPALLSASLLVICSIMIGGCGLDVLFFQFVYRVAGSARRKRH